MNKSENLTRVLSSWVHEEFKNGIQTNVSRQVRRMLLDYLSGVVAAAQEDVTTLVANHVRDQYSWGAATAIGHGKTSALGAALVNGTSAHGLETDDGYTPGSFHPSSVTFPAALAIAEVNGSSLEQALHAAAIGMEVGCRLSAASHPATRKRGFHNTPINGVFGAATASALLMNADENQIVNALGIAGSHVSGVFEFLGQSSGVKRFHPGKAARDGVAAADLAMKGLTGPQSILEGVDGYFAAYAGLEGKAWSPTPILKDLGQRWEIEKTYVKPYPCCRHLHGAIDAALVIKRKHDPFVTDIAEIRVETYSIAAGHTGTAVETMIGAQLSLPYALAVAFSKGRVDLSTYEEATRKDSQIIELMSRVTVQVDQKAEEMYPNSGRPAMVSVRMMDGTSYTAQIQFPYGEPNNPMSDVDLERKARSLAEPVVGEAGADLLVYSCKEASSFEFLTELDKNIRTDAKSYPNSSAHFM